MIRISVALLLAVSLASCRASSITAPVTATSDASVDCWNRGPAPAPDLRDVRLIDRGDHWLITFRDDPRSLAVLGRSWSFLIHGQAQKPGPGRSSWVHGPGLTGVGDGQNQNGDDSLRLSTRRVLIVRCADRFGLDALMAIRGATASISIDKTMLDDPHQMPAELMVYGGIVTGPYNPPYVMLPFSYGSPLLYTIDLATGVRTSPALAPAAASEAPAPGEDAVVVRRR